MTNIELVEEFFAAVGSGDVEALGPLLANDFVYEDQTAPAVLDKTQFIQWVGSLAAAIPDLSLDAHAITAVGTEVVADLSLAGDVVNELNLSALGQGVIPPSGVTIALPPQPVTFQFDAGCISACAADAAPDTGIGAILQILGGIATAPV